ncbi:hypothetical protein APA20_15205 [Pseudomonas aeruginosa]|nr:hypothetical protein PA50071_07960 [Pseudomonas aeruginosa DSM 50071 = NBRC 12689]OPD96369.1 hypothetical protein AO996_07280 [Pseudomonas aeruginosa]OPE01028.1 hypothetical protein APA20_15205 [Pseudomonas aeruginosa]OPE20529.1 hypothetical protein APA96_06790 [Pseudomonas aeruginosa]OPE38186.1 hypothetical protein APB53_20135 [Pseudomonas aeruginosa]
MGAVAEIRVVKINLSPFLCDIFLCNDGSISASKRSCAAYFGNAGGGTGQPAVQRLQGTTQGCACGSGSFCTGPRGGVYCLTPGGKKSYRRK